MDKARHRQAGVKLAGRGRQRGERPHHQTLVRLLLLLLRMLQWNNCCYAVGAAAAGLQGVGTACWLAAAQGARCQGIKLMKRRLLLLLLLPEGLRQC